MALTLDKIKSKYRSRFPAEKGDGAFLKFLCAVETANRSWILIENSARKKKNAEMKKLAYNNLIVNFVTALEVYLRSIVIKASKWEESGYANLLKEKVSLSEAYDLFGRKKISRQYIVAHYFSFQNLESINHIFSNLTGKDFLKEIENFEGDVEGTEDGITYLLNDLPNWRKTIVEMYDIRNRFIHEGILEAPNDQEIQDMVAVIMYFQGASHEYFEHNYALR